MTKDRLYLVGTAVALLAVLFAAILFPVVRSTVFWLFIAAACWLLLLVPGFALRPRAASKFTCHLSFLDHVTSLS